MRVLDASPFSCISAWMDSSGFWFLAFGFRNLINSLRIVHSSFKLSYLRRPMSVMMGNVYVMLSYMISDG